MASYNPSPVEKAKVVNRAARVAALNKLPRIIAETKAVNAGVKTTNANNALNAYLTNDTTYQTQTAAINKALADYQAQELNSEQQNAGTYAQNTYDLNTQKSDDLDSQADDYASRGLTRSGLYAVANSKLQNNYASQQSTLDMNSANYVTNARADLGNYRSSQALAQQQARQDAINRRALSLIGGSNQGVV